MDTNYLQSAERYELAFKVALEILERQTKRKEILDYAKSSKIFTGAYMEALTTPTSENVSASKIRRK